MVKRIIGHLDMDAFFAAVEERDKPFLKGYPIVVGADPKGGRGRGVVSTANYKARDYGIRSALPISKAWELSEKAKKSGFRSVVFMTPDFSRYSQASDKIMAIVSKYIRLVEVASIDEIYFDLSFAGSYKKAEKISQAIKIEIEKKEHLTASIGLGPNKLIAKIASDYQKPNGLTVVGSDKDERICAEFVEAFLEPMPIRKIPGIGPKTEKLFLNLGIKTIKDLKKFSKEYFEKMLGKWGLELHEKIRGVDNSPVEDFYEVKSIGEQETFEKDNLDPDLIFQRLKVMCRNISGRLFENNFEGFRTVAITVRFADFQNKSRSHTLVAPASASDILEVEVIKLLMPFFDRRENPNLKLIRLVGVRVEKLIEKSRVISLF